MAERPLLILPEAAAASKCMRVGGGDSTTKPGARRQQERLGPRFEELDKAFESKRVQLQTVSTGIIPEDVLVLDTAGTVEDFVKAVRKIDGFEFLSEYDEQDIPPDEDFFVEKNGVHVGYTGRVYMVLTNQDAFRQLQALWQRFQSGKNFDRGLAKWRDVFALLRDIRPWGVKDRLEETGVLQDWGARVQDNAEHVHCEIELWFRANLQRRHAASQAVRARVEELGGVVLGEGIVQGIHYHGLAVRLPIAAVGQIISEQTRHQVQLVQSEQIQFFRAAGQMAARSPGEKAPSTVTYLGPQPSGSPRVALLDGLPLQNHSALVSRLVVDDPDGFEMDYSADARSHRVPCARAHRPAPRQRSKRSGKCTGRCPCQDTPGAWCSLGRAGTCPAPCLRLDRQQGQEDRAGHAPAWLRSTRDRGRCRVFVNASDGDWRWRALGR